MKKSIYVGLAATLLTAALSLTSFAAGWQQDAKGYWYGTNADNTTWYTNGWQWIDGNGDGIAECYYFDGNGYMLTNTTTPDGYQVNAGGAWVQDGQAQTKNVEVAQNIASSDSSVANASIPDFTGKYSGETYFYDIKKQSDGTYKMTTELCDYYLGTCSGDYTGQYDPQTQILTLIGREKTVVYGYYNYITRQDEYYIEPITSYRDDVQRFKMGNGGRLLTDDWNDGTWKDREIFKIN